MSDSLAPVIGAVIGGDFRIESPLAEGGMGAVYVATQLSTGKRRALKLMHRELIGDAGLQQRFLQEARVVARIESDHVVEVVGAGFDPESRSPWLAMELLEGEDLSTTMSRRGAIPRDEVRAILRELCHGVGAAHAAGVVHRDLKPENIFLAASRRSGSRFMVKVLDFGIAKVLADAMMKQTAAIGTPEWMAPEQSTPGYSIGPPTDVWSIGLLAFTLLTGKPFWRSAQRDVSSSYSLMRETLFDEIPPASRRAAELGVGHLLPTGFDAWFGRAVARDPASRFAEARQAFATLDPVLGGAVAGAPKERIDVTVPDPLAGASQPEPPARPPVDVTVRTPPVTPPVDVTVRTPPNAPSKTISEQPWQEAFRHSAPPGLTALPDAGPYPAAPGGYPAAPGGYPAVGGGGYPAPPAAAMTPAGPRIAPPPPRQKPSGSRGGAFTMVAVGLGGALVVALFIGVAMSSKGRDKTTGDTGTLGGETDKDEARRKADEAKAARDKVSGVMGKIPGGTFRMGLADETEEAPVHPVTLPPFEMDLTEVTGASYQACVAAGACSPAGQLPIWPGAGKLLQVYEQHCNARHPDRGNHPVNCVDWMQASAFCAWAGKRLPTEEEWDYAARGGVEGARYPWGSSAPTSAHVNGCGVECQSLFLRSGFRAVLTYNDRDPFETTAPVGTFRAGDSKFGMHDMQRNVWEWTASAYCSYQSPGCADPRKVHRGRSWDDYLPGLGYGPDRFGSPPGNRLPSVGFRCARSAPTPAAP